MTTKLYNDYSSYLRERYGTKVYRIGIDAGFTCPNRDGTKGVGGCAYCNESGSRAAYADPALSVAEQLKSRIEVLRRTKCATKFIAYFQAFSNTYADIATLGRAYDEATNIQDIVGITIGTRPDAVDHEKLELIASYRDRYDVWIEYGLQSSHDRTLTALNRGHTYADFTRAVALAKAVSVPVTAHIILGLPGETPGEMIETATRLSKLGIDGIKIHLLHILKGSALEGAYGRGEVELLRQDDYVGLVCDILEHLSPKILIQRLTGEGPRGAHIAPDWAQDKLGTIAKIRAELQRRGSRQGKRAGSS